MRTKFAILLAIAGLFITALSADAAITLPSENVRVHSEKFYDNLSDRMLMASTTQPIPVIVMLNATATPGAVERLQALTGGFNVDHVYSVIPGFAAALTTGQIAALARDATVQQIEYDDEVHAHLGSAQTWYGTTKARTDFGVDGNMDGDWTVWTKDDVVIVILDTGIDTLHITLDYGKVIGWKDFVNDSVAPYDDHGHGTHCAAIAAGGGGIVPPGYYDHKGVAPGAALVGVKVLNSGGCGTESNIIAGINWVVANKDVYNIRVLSISLGNSRSSNGGDAVSMACNNAVDAGIVVCVSAGNDGPATKTIGSPAAAEKVITVGAMSDCDNPVNGYYLADFSSRGPTKDKRVKPDICAPGVRITAARAGMYHGYLTYSGTSQAAPFVAGTAALMLDANTGLTPADIKSMLMSTAQDWGPEGTDIDYGSGRLQSYDAVWEVAGGDYDPPVVPEHVYVSDALKRNKTDIWEVEVDDLSYPGDPIAVTMIMPDWKSGSSPNFDLYLYDPSDELVKEGTSSEREDYIGYRPTETGFYEIWVTSVSGSGNYFFDLSCASATSVTKTQEGFGPQAKPVALSQSCLELVPNPAQAGRVAVRYSLPHAGQMTVTLVDISGRVVQTQEVAAGLKGAVSVDVSGLSAGVYMARLVAGDLDVSQPLVIAR